MRDHELERPQQPMMAVLFNKHENFQEFVKDDPSLKKTAGFWSRENNIAFFYAQDSDDVGRLFKGLGQAMVRLRDELQQLLKKIRGTPEGADVVRVSNALQLLIRIYLEELDVQVTSHEATHQLAGNSGLLPRQVQFPLWVQEGLATLFEASRGAGWAGIGSVNEERLLWYRALDSARKEFPSKEKASLDLNAVISDRIFRLARSAQFEGTIEYSESWALTHFLVNNYFDELMTYYAHVARMPEDLPLSEDTLKQSFAAVFAKRMNTLEQEWRRHVNGLQTDGERLEKKLQRQDR